MIACNCTITQRKALVDCYTFMEDGTVWVVYTPCVHGVVEISPLYMPKYGRINNEPQSADETTAVLIEA